MLKRQSCADFRHRAQKRWSMVAASRMQEAANLCVPNRHEATQIRKFLVLVLITLCRHILPCLKAHPSGKHASFLGLPCFLQ